MNGCLQVLEEFYIQKAPPKTKNQSTNQPTKDQKGSKKKKPFKKEDKGIFLVK